MIERIQKIISYSELTTSGFADKMEIGRPMLSHILNGRNKPSLNFIMQLLSCFPEISPDWLLFGQGEFLRQADSHVGKNEISPKDPQQNLFKEPTAHHEDEPPLKDDPLPSFSSPSKLVWIYDDNTFEVLKSR